MQPAHLLQPWHMTASHRGDIEKVGVEARGGCGRGSRADSLTVSAQACGFAVPLGLFIELAGQQREGELNA